MSSQKYPLGIAPSCAVDEYIGSDFDIVKKVAENLDTIEAAASLVGPEATSLFTSILEKLGHNVVGSFEKGATINGPQDFVTYQERVYHYSGDIFPYVIQANSQPNSDFARGYRGSVKDWDAFDKALLQWADEPITGEPDTDTDSKRLNALKKLGLSQYWDEGKTLNVVGTLVRFGKLEYEVVSVPALMGTTPENDPNFRKWTVTPDDVVPGVVDQVKQYRDEAQAAASTSAAQAVSSSGSADIARDQATLAVNSADVADKAGKAAKVSELSAIQASNTAVAAKNTAVDARDIAVASQNAIDVMNTNVNAKHAEVVTKHADVVAQAATVASQAITASEAALNAKQSADMAKASEQRVANNASAAQQAEIEAENHAVNAAASAKAATNSATEASNMANIAVTASQSATTSSQDASNAAAEATKAANSVAGSEQAAATSAKSAADSATLADTYRTESQQASIEARQASESANTHAKQAIISATNADTAAKSVQGIADQVLPSVAEAKSYADSAKADAKLSTDNAVLAGNHATTAKNSITISTAKATEALQSANTAAVSAQTAVTAKDRCEEIYNNMQTGVVVKGSWDACTNAYPTDKSATARWDVVVNCGDSHDFDGKTFRNGDILYYDKTDDAFYHTPVQGAGGVTSVNTKTGDVILTADDVGALSKTGKAANSALLDGFTKADIIAEAVQDSVSDSELNTALSAKLDKTAQAADSLKLGGKTKTEVIAEARTGMATEGSSYTKLESDARYPEASAVVKKSGDTMTGFLTVPNLNVTAGLINLVNGRLQFDSAGNTRVVSKSKAEFGLYDSGLHLKVKYPDGTYYPVFHEGNMPTLTQLGAYPKDGGDLDGNVTLKNTPLGQAIKNAIYFGSAIPSAQALFADGLGTYVGNDSKQTVIYGSDLKFGTYKVYHEGNKPTAADVGALAVTAKASDSARLDGKTKNEVITEARTGLLTSDDVYTKTRSDERYPTKVAADAKYYSDTNKPSTATLGAVNKAGDTMTGTLVVPGPNGLKNDASSGWSYIALKSGTTQADIAFTNLAVEGALANSIHLRPLGNPNGSLIVQPNNQTIQKTQYGWIGIGAQNANYVHFNTNLPKVFFNKPMYVQGEIYTGSSYNQRVYHEGYKPSLAALGAFPAAGGTMTGHLTANGKITTVLRPYSWISGFQVGYPSIYINTLGGTGAYSSWMTQRTPSGGISFGTLGDNFYIKYAKSADIDANTNAALDMLTMNSAGNVYTGANHYADTFYSRSGQIAFASSANDNQGMYLNPTDKRTIIGGGNTSGSIVLRPKGINDTAGQFTLNPTGAVVTTGSMTIGDAYGRAGGASASYGSIDVAGAKGNYAGIHFRDVSRTLMIHPSVQGIHTGSGWQWYWSDGVLTAGTVPWARLSSVPTAATRWPTFNEVTSKPAYYPPTKHSHSWGEINGIPQTATRWPTWSEVSGKPAVANEWVPFYSSSVIQGRIAIPTAARTALNSGKSVRFEVCCQSPTDFGTGTVIFPAHMWPSGSKKRINSVVEGFSYFWIHNSNSGWGSNANYLTFENGNCIYAAYQILG